MQRTTPATRGDEAFELKEFMLTVHRLIESKEKRARITRPEMAARVGSSKRTYTEYLLGTVKPHAMRVLLQMLALMDDEDIVRMVRLWAARNPIVFAPDEELGRGDD